MSEFQAEPSWYFASTGGGIMDGFNDSSREHFEGAHEHFLAREIIQNSIDARFDYKEPVKVVFELKKAILSDIPGLGELRDYYTLAKDYASDQEGAAEFYDAALNTLALSEIQFLRAGDYNTRGLDGADEDTGSNWARLVLMEGASSKKGAGGGSYGIGKNAAFVASALRTVYYVSSPGEGQIVYSGKSKISSFKIKDDIKQGAGQYGYERTDKPGVSSVRNEKDIAGFFKRTKRGTDIFIAGYRPTDDDWRNKLKESVLKNFWAAIHSGDLIVEFLCEGEDTETIECSNLRTYLDEYKDAEDNALPYYLAMTECQPIEKELKHLGLVKLYVRVGDNMPRKVVMMRQPKMVVRSKRVSTLHENYSAVFLCENDKGNSILRELEPPAHSEWDQNRKDGRYKNAIIEMDRFLRDTMRAMNPQIDDQPEDIPGLSRYLWDIEERDDLASLSAGNGENTDKTTDLESPREVAQTDESSKLPKQTQTQNLAVVNSSLGTEPPVPGTKGMGGKPGRGGSGGDPGGNSSRMDTDSFTFRSFATKGTSGLEYRVVINPLREAQGSIKIMAVGEDGEYPVVVASATDEHGINLDIEESMIKGIKLAKGSPYKIALRLDSGRRYALGVESYEN